jgi:hypothetical protein
MNKKNIRSCMHYVVRRGQNWAKRRWTSPRSLTCDFHNSGDTRRRRDHYQVANDSFVTSTYTEKGSGVVCKLGSLTILLFFFFF